MRHSKPVGPPNATHSMKEIDVTPLSLIYLMAKMFCADAIVVGRPPALPPHARPKRIALINGSSGSSVLMIGSEKVRKIVVEAMFERKADVVKLRSINVRRTMCGRVEILENANCETLSVMLSFASAAEIVSEPRKTKIIGSVNFAAIEVASC